MILQNLRIIFFCLFLLFKILKFKNDYITNYGNKRLDYLEDFT